MDTAEGACGAREDRHGGLSNRFQHAQGVGGGGMQGCIAMDGADAEEGQAGVVGGKEESAGILPR